MSVELIKWICEKEKMVGFIMSTQIIFIYPGCNIVMETHKAYQSYFRSFVIVWPID